MNRYHIEHLSERRSCEDSRLKHNRIQVAGSEIFSADLHLISRASFFFLSVLGEKLYIRFFFLLFSGGCALENATEQMCIS